VVNVKVVEVEVMKGLGKKEIMLDGRGNIIGSLE
jgi:hypothetical protein